MDTSRNRNGTYCFLCHCRCKILLPEKIQYQRFYTGYTSIRNSISSGCVHHCSFCRDPQRKKLRKFFYESNFMDTSFSKYSFGLCILEKKEAVSIDSLFL